MSWKEFLKPDWRKIILTIPLFIWGIFGFFIVVSEMGFNILFVIGLIGMVISLPIILIFFSTSLIPIEVLNVLSVLMVILDVLYAYLISCLIAWVYDKLKKR